jgi:2-amino-4-hydroxy-6-hydroxymethyldihydropteridine diphosphokinase
MPAQPYHTVGIALGSNIQDPEAQIQKAIDFLKSLSLDQHILYAPTIQSAPVDCPAGSPCFLNTVAEIHWVGTSEDLLSTLQNYEQQRGRPKQRERNAPRPIDLDILYIDEIISHDQNLILPHPRAHMRDFVIEPLRRIAPERAEWILAKAKENRY